MMLVTLTWLPPSCAAMLPQKFSAATTWIVFPPAEPDDEAVVDDALPEVEQEASVIVAAIAATPTANLGSRRTVRRRTTFMAGDLLRAFRRDLLRLDENDFQNQFK
jgi:hypothetical protein